MCIASNATHFLIKHPYFYCSYVATLLQRETRCFQLETLNLLFLQSLTRHSQFLRATISVFLQHLNLSADKMPEMVANGTSEEVWTLNTPLAQSDPEVSFQHLKIIDVIASVQVESLIKAEKARQRAGLEMIASENFTSLPVIILSSYQCLILRTFV